MIKPDEVRLIDANALKKDIGQYMWNYGPEYAIDQAPTVEAVSVVRCGQCKNGHESEDNFDFDKTPLIECGYMTEPNRPHEFCSWGKAKEDEPDEQTN